MSKTIGSGLLRAILDAIHGSDERIAGQAITTLTATLLPASTTIDVASTTGFGEWQDGAGDALVVIDGEIIYCSGRTLTSFTGLTRGKRSTRIPTFAPVGMVVYDLAQNSTAVDLVRRGILVDYAIDEDLTTVGRNLGMHRCPGIDDSTYRRLIRAIAYLAKQPPSAVVTAMTALVGAGGFKFYERLVTAPNRFFVEVGTPAASSLSGRFYLNSGERHIVDGAGKVTTTYPIGTSALLGAYAAGNIRVVSGAHLVDGEVFVLNDGVHAAVTFEFDNNGSVVPSPTLRAVNFTAGSTELQMRDAVIAAIAGAPTLDITASAADPSNVALQNDAIGTAGNVAITTTVADSVFAVSGMAGGLAAGTSGGIAIYLDNSATREGARDSATNYFPGGSFAGSVITPGTPLAPGTAVLVDYNGHRAHYLAPDDTFVNDGTDFPPYFSDDLLAARCVLDQVRAAGVGVELSAIP